MEITLAIATEIIVQAMEVAVMAEQTQVIAIKEMEQ